MKAKKQTTKKADAKKEKPADTLAADIAQNPGKTEVPAEQIEFKGDGSRHYKVSLDGVKGHSAIVSADSKADAEEAFKNLFGILSTDKKIRCIPDVDPDDFRLNTFGVILDE